MAEQIVIPMSIILPLRKKRKEILLGLKSAQSKIGANTRAPYGGKKRVRETDIACAIREFEEESKIKLEPTDLILVGQIDFHRPINENLVKVGRCKIYTVDLKKHHGRPKSTDEMSNPQWYPIDGLPYKALLNDQPAMLEDCQHWMPKILVDSCKVFGEVHFGPDQKLIYWRISVNGNI